MLPMISISLLELKQHAAFWVGFAEDCGDSHTHMVLDTDTFKIIYRSAIRFRTLKNPNQSLFDPVGEEDHQPHSKNLKHPTSSQMVINQLSQISQLSS